MTEWFLCCWCAQIDSYHSHWHIHSDPALALRFNDTTPALRFNEPAPALRFNEPAPALKFNEPAPALRFNEPAPALRFNDPTTFLRFNNPTTSLRFDNPTSSLRFNNPTSTLRLNNPTCALRFDCHQLANSLQKNCVRWIHVAVVVNQVTTLKLLWVAESVNYTQTLTGATENMSAARCGGADGSFTWLAKSQGCSVVLHITMGRLK